MADDSDLASALINGKVSANFNLRYEAVEQDNTAKNADAFTLGYQLSEATRVSYAYLTKRNHIFSDEKDVDSQDHLLNISHQLSAGKLTGYAYLLEEDKAGDAEIHTLDVRYVGAANLGDNKVTYSIEFAQKDNDTVDKSVSYFAIKAGTQIASLNVKSDYEVLGSDNGEYGFAIPLATLHKFNGWTD